MQAQRRPLAAAFVRRTTGSSTRLFGAPRTASKDPPAIIRGEDAAAALQKHAYLRRSYLAGLLVIGALEEEP